MKKVQLEIVGLSYSQSQSGAYALILGMKGGSKRLPIIIGGFEAQAIAIHLENMTPTRPMTHDLFKNFAIHYGIKILEVVINKFEEGIFFSKLVCELNGKISEIDSRTSDAVALAIRFGCPIYTYSRIIDVAGITQEDVAGSDVEEPLEEASSTKEGYDQYSLEELEELLQKAVTEEDFEEASRIRDEINNRKQASG